MNIKSHEINKINFKSNKFILFYGQNEGFKNEAIKNLLNKKAEILRYDEKEILDDSANFLSGLFTKSLFEEEKIIVIKRASEKILKIIDEIKFKNLQDLNIIINAGILDKKSKLRSLFEKEKEFISVAFYPDNEQTLSRLAYNFFKERKLSISSSNINLIISRCNNDRENLFNELQKIENFARNNKKVSTEVILKITNLTENYNISELIDNCLAKNKKKIINILNENNFSHEDCIIITRTFLHKSKKILQLSEEFKKNNNIDLTISSAKPPIFWKDKEVTKQQIFKWPPENIKNLIYKLNELELSIKKNIANSINLITDFILEQASLGTNN